MVEYKYMRLFRMLHHWLVPHEHNNHRGRALHQDSLLALVLLLGIFNLGIRAFKGTAPDVLGYATDIRIEQLFSATNAKRAEAGLPALTLNGTLSQAAAAKAADMFANNYWAHNSPAGKTPWDFIIGAGYRYTLAGENLAKNFQTSDGVVDAWMNSPTHKANIVKDGYKEIGFAVVNGVLNGEETTLVVQMFGATSAPIAQVPKVQAAERKPTSIPSPTTVPVAQVSINPTAATQPQPTIEVAPTTAPAFTETPVFAGGLSFDRVVIRPRIDIEAVTNNIVFILAGLLIGLLAVDAFIVRKKGVVRLAGHNVAHIVFLGTIVVSGLALTRGSLL